MSFFVSLHPHRYMSFHATTYRAGGHTNTERGYLPILAQKLLTEHSEEFKDEGLDDVEVLVSEQDRHPLAIV
jgi:hypothetical protein